MNSGWTSGKKKGNNRLLFLAAGLVLLLVVLIAFGPGENAGIGQLISSAAPDSSGYVPDSAALASGISEEKDYLETPVREPVVDTSSKSADAQPAADSVSKSPEVQPAAPAVVTSGNVLSYRIRKGDTFFKIAAMFGNKPAELQELNGMSDMNLQADSDIKVKIKASHTVGQGEGLNAIAEKYGVPAKSIKIANGLSSESLASGTTLIIPLK
jgi:LysM repeat protein